MVAQGFYGGKSFTDAEMAERRVGVDMKKRAGDRDCWVGKWTPKGDTARKEGAAPASSIFPSSSQMAVLSAYSCYLCYIPTMKYLNTLIVFARTSYVIYIMHNSQVQHGILG